MNKDILKDNGCSISINSMQIITERERHCLSCSQNISDLSQLSIKEIADNHYGKNKCVILTNDQIDFFKYFKNIKAVTAATGLFLGTTFFGMACAQNTEKHVDSCYVKGRLIGDEVSRANRWIHISLKDSDTVYETKSDEKGRFSLNLPKNCEIEHSNIPELKSYVIEDKKVINFRHVKLVGRSRAPGFL